MPLSTSTKGLKKHCKSLKSVKKIGVSVRSPRHTAPYEPSFTTVRTAIYHHMTRSHNCDFFFKIQLVKPKTSSSTTAILYTLQRSMTYTVRFKLRFNFACQVFEKIEFSSILYTILYKINRLQYTLTSSCKSLKSLVIFLYNNINRLAVGLTPPDKSLILLRKSNPFFFSIGQQVKLR